MLIRLFQQTPIDWGLACGKIGCAAYFIVRRWITGGSEAEQGLECSHGLLAAIVSKDKLVEINRELTAADAVMGSDQPLLQVANCAVS